MTRANSVLATGSWQLETGNWQLAADIHITDSEAGAQLAVRVTPRAGRPGVAGIRDGTLLIRLAAPPVEGAANAALVEFLAGLIGRPKRDVTIVAGGRSRDKRVRIAGVSARDLREKLSAILAA